MQNNQSPKKQNNEADNEINQKFDNKLDELTEESLVFVEKRVNELIQDIREIQNSQLQNQELTEQTKQQNRKKIREITIQILKQQSKLPKIQAQTAQKQKQQQNTNKQQITEQQITQRMSQLLQQPNDSTWTDATDSQADDQQVWMVDDDIMNAMQEEQDQNGEQIQQGEQGEEGEQNQQKKQEIDIGELEEQFVTGQQSDHIMLFGKHDKFCVSTNGVYKQDLLLSGGGDDYLFMYNFPKQEANKDETIHPFHMVKHTETINKIQISYSKQFVFSITDNQILCTQIKTKQTTTLKAKGKKQQKTNKISENKSDDQKQDEQPICSDMVCHHLGDVVAVSSGYQLQIFNIKGLKLYQTYYCDKVIEMMAFVDSGKQIALACEDNRLRLLTPKTSEIVTVAGPRQHRVQISVLKTKGDIILSGDIDGYIGVTSIKKATLTSVIGIKDTEQVEGAINQLQFAGNYFIAASNGDFADWYDLSKTKKLFQSPIQGSASDICWQGADYQHIYNVSTIKGNIHLFDCRNPLNEAGKTRAGNTVHKMWCEAHLISAACEDGQLRLFDIRKLL